MERPCFGRGGWGQAERSGRGRAWVGTERRLEVPSGAVDTRFNGAVPGWARKRVCAVTVLAALRGKGPRQGMQERHNAGRSKDHFPGGLARFSSRGRSCPGPGDERHQRQRSRFQGAAWSRACSPVTEALRCAQMSHMAQPLLLRPAERCAGSHSEAWPCDTSPVGCSHRGQTVRSPRRVPSAGVQFWQSQTLLRPRPSPQRSTSENREATRAWR